MKLLRLLLAICIALNITFAHNKSSAEEIQNLGEWISYSENSGRIQKVVFVPLKVNTSLNISNQKYAQEIGYYFYKLGFQGSPIGYAIFPNKQYFEINPNVHRTLTNNNLDKNTLVIALVYKNEFKPQDFAEGISSFSGQELRLISSISSLKSAEDIELRNMSIKLKENNYFLEFGEILPSVGEIRKQVLLDFNSKVQDSIKIDQINIASEVNPNDLTNADFIIRNNVAFDVPFNKSYSLALSFSGDSKLFVSETWVTQKIAILKQSTFIPSLSTTTYKTKFKTPVLSGTYKDTITLFINDTKYDQKEFSFVVKDVGQKVLKIRYAPLGVAVRKDPTTNSAEINKVGEGALFIYTEVKDNFYKITLPDGRVGWVGGNYVELVKK